MSRQQSSRPHKPFERLSEVEKGILIGLHKDDMKIFDIAKKKGISKTTVTYIIKKYNETGSATNKKPTERPSKLTARDKRHLFLDFKWDCHQNLVEMADLIKKKAEKKVSKKTINQMLHKMNLVYCVIKSKPLLTKEYIAKRRAWYRKIKDWKKQ
ncbi:Homeodomain-like DNA binding domain-containing transcription factor [Phycomyces blakesleeanus NRRL 1555(-)]|uniref:Homeodomain-like DNA binding domain-containing transcription factor n=1 Tax=Phycomyces blakesleeanus (strain ATCC 8743b / DSM 1359 / FGSC 10004 / NBRC 33097 / NRRL 1555) TaxID=763407 RepID=A0A162WFF0_PHYB8|nr:Homeodomain-like DNA binding domain-containing transcription factor [Phycomyces blakesleeanus NRRL 1555(-)]OAD66785.1 Homeodomain-like DNA binding domain-containing transcription factor [Phycomyces blakesleeanus NRRL 1555(-)]|eukprot:XP_018284825.1 Homeodomain-like DNA binding domain-containing transcription factor [Phycomyces blakesleeanus NRRL 1555(-)]